MNVRREAPGCRESEERRGGMRKGLRIREEVR